MRQRKKAELKHGAVIVLGWFPMRKHFLGDGVWRGSLENRKQELVGDKPGKLSEARSWKILNVRLRKRAFS